ncbi:MAG: tetratricopeptide repeat protein [Chloroflexaceae bacterium]|nr:tetratricopeptide repeat protein [Chloroflexaceae bacterium]
MGAAVSRRVRCVAGELPRSTGNRYHAALGAQRDGWTLFQLQRYEEAISSFSRAIELAPTFANAHYGRGESYEAQRQVNEARADYRRAVDLDPDNAQYQQALDRIEG